jgi:hypothetical protein
MEVSQMVQLRFALLASLLSLSLAAPALAADDALRGAVRLGYTRTDGQAAPELAPFQYLSVGFRLDGRYVSFDFDSVMPIVIVDGIATLVRVIAGGAAELPIYGAMNGGLEPGLLPFFAMSARYNFQYDGVVRLGVGPQLRYLLLSPYYQGERETTTSLDVGLRATAALELERVRLIGALAAGNGWMDDAALNPYIGGGAEVEVPLWRLLGVFARGEVRGQRVDRREWGQPPYASTAAPEGIRQVSWWTLWSLDAGVAILF